MTTRIAENGRPVDLKRVESLAQLRWTAFILFFFLIQAVLWTVAISLTSHDPSHKVLDEYGESPQAWKERLALERASAALGWQPQIEIQPTSDLRRQRSARLVLLDREGQPVEGATVQLKAYHTGHAAEAQQLEATESEPGRYDFSLRVHYFGNWRFEGDVKTGDQRFVFKDQQWLQRESGQ